MRKYKYIDKESLKRVNYRSHHILKYNRTLYASTINALPDDKLFPITFTLLHEHKAGVACDPHVRCIIVAPRPEGGMQQLILDVEMDIYERLPEVELPDLPTDAVKEPAV